MFCASRFPFLNSNVWTKGKDKKLKKKLKNSANDATETEKLLQLYEQRVAIYVHLYLKQQSSLKQQSNVTKLASAPNEFGETITWVLLVWFKLGG